MKQKVRCKICGTERINIIKNMNYETSAVEELAEKVSNYAHPDTRDIVESACISAIHQALTERDREIKQIVVEDVPHQYQGRLLETLTPITN